MKSLSLAILDILLPSKWPRLVAGAAVSLITGIFALSEWGQKVGLILTPEEMSRIRREGIPWLCVVALALIHYLVVREKNSLLNLQPWKLHEKVKLTIGNYYDVTDKENNKIIRITLKETSRQMMPLPYTNIGNGTHTQIEADTATLIFDDFLSILPCQAVKPIPVAMPFNECSFIFSKNSNSEEANSVFSFVTEGYEQFFRCFVDHINLAKQEVEIDVYFLQMKKKV